MSGAAKLTPKQERFVAEYLIDLNATQAAIRAGYAKGSASVAGARLLANAKVAAAVEEGKKAINAELVMTRQEVLERLSLIGRADPRRLYRKDGTLKPMHEMDDVAAASIAGVEVERTEVGKGKGKRVRVEVAKVKHRDPVRALELLGKHHALWSDQPPPPPEGPGLTIVVQQGVEVSGNRVVHGTRVKVNLPGPE